MIPWYYKSQIYGNYWRMDNGVYPYTILFYEKEGDSYSCKDKFPLTLSDNSKITKDEFTEIVKEAFEQLNSLNIGVSFTCQGYGTTDKDPAFDMQDDLNALVYYWNWKYGGLAGPLGKKGFGIKLGLSAGSRKEWYIGCTRHEMTHCLGFAHKGDMFGSSTVKMPFVGGIKAKEEFTEDTVGGFDIVYNTSTKYKIYGTVNPILYKEGQVFIIKHKTRELIYQTVVDSKGYFEFRLRKKLHKVRLFILSKQGRIYNYAFLRRPIKSFQKEYELPVKKLEYGDATSIQLVSEITNTKLIY